LYRKLSVGKLLAMLVNGPARAKAAYTLLICIDTNPDTAKLISAGTAYTGLVLILYANIKLTM